MYSLLRKTAENYDRDLIAFTTQLLDISSSSFNESIAGDAVEKKMVQLGYDRVIRDRIGNCVGVLYGREYEPTLLLMTHIDTVRTPDTQSRIDDNRLYGIGASDCKAGLAAHVYAGKLLKESHLQLRGNLLVVATVAEHNGFSIGTRHFLHETLPGLGLTASFAILGEPTDLAMFYGHDGWIGIDIILDSTDTVSLHESADALLNFLRKTIGTTAHSPSHQQNVAIDNPSFTFSNAAGRCVIRITHRIHAAHQIPGILKTTRNTIAIFCKQYTTISVYTAIARVNIGTAKDPCTIKLVSLPWMTDALNPFFEEARLALRSVQCTVRGGLWELEKLGMGTSGSALAKAGIPVIGYGPGSARAAHEENEFVDLDSIREALFGTAVIAYRLVGVASPGLTRDHQ